MCAKQIFGGLWTEEKLGRLRKYLHAYTTIFTRNKKAAYYRTVYVDAFAGCGYRCFQHDNQNLLLPIYDDKDIMIYKKGSVQIALDNDPPFDQYVFVDLSSEFVSQLESIRRKPCHEDQNIEIIQSDANAFLVSWCNRTDWERTRAVVFLDPYGMQVQWSTIETIAMTRAIDLWYLFPLGMAVNRMLPRSGPPEGPWADCLTSIFGTDRWREAFYRPTKQLTMFGRTGNLEKEADFGAIGEFFVERLKAVFAGVAERPLPLCNSKNTPLFLLTFAAANPRTARLAVKIANAILRT